MDRREEELEKPRRKRQANCPVYRERRKSWISGTALEGLSSLPKSFEMSLGVSYNEAFRRDSISSESSTSETNACDMRGSVEHLVHGSRSRFTPKEFISVQGSSVWTKEDLKLSIEALLLKNGETLANLDATLKSCSDQQKRIVATNLQFPALLLSCLDGSVSTVRYVLKTFRDLEQRDNKGRNALHYAASGWSPTAGECVSLLVAAGARVEVWDSDSLATPLICAAAAGNASAVASLLKHGADVNAGLDDTKRGEASSALLLAVRGQNAECVRLLLQYKAIVNGSRAYSEAPIHVAAAHGDAECLQLLLDAKADTRVLVGSSRTSALHLAAEEGSVSCVRLLLEAQADCNATNAKGQTPLHLAALSQVTECVSLLIDAGANVGARDAEQRTALHCAVVKSSRSTEVLRRLITAGADVNAQDDFGFSPLHLAALNENSTVATYLVLAGADLTSKTKGGSTALTFLVRRTPDVLCALQQRLDSAVALTEHDVLDADCEARLDFRVVVPSHRELGETALFTTLIAAGQKHLLQHPLCKAFLHLKWFKVRALFLASLLFHAAFVIFLSAAVLGIYLPDTYDRFVSHNNSSETLNCTSNPDVKGCQYHPFIRVTGWITILLGICFAIKEGFQLVQNPKDYVRNWENWVQVCILVGLVLVAVNRRPEDWQHHVAAVVIVLAWTELMMLVGRFPAFGLYVQMFQTVAINIAKFLMAYLCLIIGFSFGIALLFPKDRSLSEVPASILTTLVMMTGEIEYKEHFFDDKVQFYPGTAHIIFLGFLLFIVIVLMNLLVGMAVSDIQGLQKSAGLDRLVRQAKLVARMENIVFSSWLNFCPFSVRKYLHGVVRLIPTQSHCAYTFRPHDPREERLPTDVKEGIAKILLSRSSKNKHNSAKVAFRTFSFINDDSNDDAMLEVSRQLASQLTQLTLVTSNIERRISSLEHQWNKTIKQLDDVLNNLNCANNTMQPPDICINEP